MELKVNNKGFKNFQDYKMSSMFNSVASTVQFQTSFNPFNSNHKAMFKPYSYPPFTVSINNRLMITGVLLNKTFKLSSKANSSSVSGYSKSGVIQDCTAPLESYPLEFNNLTIKEIAEKLCAPFKVNVTVTSEALSKASEPYVDIEMGDQETIKSFLEKLCNDRNLVLTHDIYGGLVITVVNTNELPVQSFGSGIPGVEVTLTTNEQGMHRDILVMASADLESDNASESSIVNPYVSVARNTTKSQSSGDEFNTESAARSELGKELKNISVKISMDRDTWVQRGQVMPNSIIAIESPVLYLYSRTLFFVEGITIERKANKETATLSCVPREVYTDDEVQNIFE